MKFRKVKLTEAENNMAHSQVVGNGEMWIKGNKDAVVR
jgi:hypothetical protein